MLRRRHPNKSKGWLFGKYWKKSQGRHIFTASAKTAKGMRIYSVVRLGALPPGRHVKIPKEANPYLPEYGKLFWERRHQKERRVLPALSAREYRTMRTCGG
jgi:RNA-directed DNA polymerase